MTIFELERRLDKFDIRAEIVEVIYDISPDIEALQRGQLSIGKLASGKPIKNIKTGSETYGVMCGEIRFQAGKQIDFFDLRFTGEFYASIKVSDVSAEDFKISS